MNLNTWGQFGQFYGRAGMGSGHSFCNNYGQYSWQPPPPSCDFRRFGPFVFNRFYYPLSPAPQMMPVPQFPPAFNQYYPQNVVVRPETRISRRSLWQNGEESGGVVIEDVSESRVEPIESATKMADEIISEEVQPLRLVHVADGSGANGDGINSGSNNQSENDSENDSPDEIRVDDYEDEALELEAAVNDMTNENIEESIQLENNSVHEQVTSNGPDGSGKIFSNCNTNVSMFTEGLLNIQNVIICTFSEIPSGAQINPAGLIALENVVDGPAFVTRRSDRLRRKLISDDKAEQEEHTEGSSSSKKRSKWLQCRRKNCFCCTYKP